MNNKIKTDVVVLGGGPGGYTSAFRAADLGKKVTIIEDKELGGVCLNVGCIPSKVFLHAAKLIDDAGEFSRRGIDFGKPKIDVEKLKTWKDDVVKRLTGGLKYLAKQRKVDVVKGYGKFISQNEIMVEGEQGATTIEFENAIISVGSKPIALPFMPDDPRIIDSTGALELKGVKGDLLIIGGGIIGLEMATVYHALGAKITVVDVMDQLMPGTDNDLVKPLYKRISNSCENVFLKTKVTKVNAKKDGLYVDFDGESSPKKPQQFDHILVCVGRSPNGLLIDAKKAGINVTEKGFIPVDKQLRTNVSHIFAVGDVVGNPMLAHKAMAEGRIAAEVIAGNKRYFEPNCIPAVAYTDPEIAWAGVSEMEAKEQDFDYDTGIFPWSASGRSLTMGRNEGLTKLIFEKKSKRVIGGGIVGPNASDLIAEIALAIEIGCDAEDLSLTIHPHPTLSETVSMAAEVFDGTVTDL